jgi:hypothetical protein
MMHSLRRNGLMSHSLQSESHDAWLSHASLIFALDRSACLRRVVLPAHCLHRPASALPASCRFYVFPSNLCRTR